MDTKTHPHSVGCALYSIHNVISDLEESNQLANNKWTGLSSSTFICTIRPVCSCSWQGKQTSQSQFLNCRKPFFCHFNAVIYCDKWGKGAIPLSGSSLPMKVLLTKTTLLLAEHERTHPDKAVREAGKRPTAGRWHTCRIAIWGERV